MIKIENFEVLGWEHAIRGMRNPLNSWGKSDSSFCHDPTCGSNVNCTVCLNMDCHAWHVGTNDLDLMTRLRNAGTDHRKFMRMLTVYVDLTAPLYWWKEFDTYKVGTVANSCSTMHKIHAKEFTLDDFSYEHLFDSDKEELAEEDWVDVSEDGFMDEQWDSIEFMKMIVRALNVYRKRYLETNDKRYWWQMIQLLPSSYNQKRTVMLNYEVLERIYFARRHHKLDEWHVLCDWIEELPYFKQIVLEGETDD